MAVWEHLNVDKAHVAYAIIGIFAAIFSLVSLFVKEKAYIGEATVATIVGLIVGPHVLNWFSPTSWGNSDYITLEISRIVLCLQIFAVAVELPKKYMLKHYLSVFMLLVPVMTAGWLIVGAFMYLVLDRLNFAEALVVSACITATDPVLAAAVVGKGKFAKRVPGHLRNLLSAESGCNDGMAFPFIYLGINLVINKGHPGEIIKDWICITILYECILGCFIGIVIGYLGRHSIKWAESKMLIDRESFLAFYVVLAMSCAGIGSMLGVDDLLVSFAAGAAFSWDGWFARKTEESHVSTVIDLLLNLAYFVYFGAIIPWPQFNSPELGLPVWRLIILSIVIIFLRRIPAVLALKPFIPDVKSWREALFCGHFGPIGVGAVFAAILARAELEGAHHPSLATPTQELPPEDSEYGYLVAIIWPVVTFLIVTSIVVHGSSVAVMTLGRHLNTMNLSMSFTTTGGNEKSSSWMSRLPELRGNGRSFSLHRVDTQAPTLVGDTHGQLTQTATVETSGVPVRPAGGMEKRRKHRHHKRRGLKRVTSYHDEVDEADREKIQHEKEAKAATFALGGGGGATGATGVSSSSDNNQQQTIQDDEEEAPSVGITPANTFVSPVEFPSKSHPAVLNEESEVEEDKDLSTSSGQSNDYDRSRRATNMYTEGSTVIVEDQHGEILNTAKLLSDSTPNEGLKLARSNTSSISSVISPSRIPGFTGEKKKFVAYKTADQLIIESEDGEIVRRYKINPHKSKPDSSEGQRNRSSSMLSDMTGKALSAVGLKKMAGSTAAPASVPVTPVKTGAGTNALGPDHVIREDDEEQDDDEEDSEVDDDESEVEGFDEEETAVERQRRLAALGELSDDRDDSDEEEVPGQSQQQQPQHSQKSKVGALVGSLMPHAIAEEKTMETKKSISFQDTPKPSKG